MIINGALFLFILGVWVSYKLACWCGEKLPPLDSNQQPAGCSSDGQS